MRNMPAVLRRIMLYAALCVFLCSGASAASVFSPSSEEAAARQALLLFCRCAFHPEYAQEEEGRLIRWEQNEITLWVGGAPTREDLRCVDAFVEELREKVDGLPEIRRVRQDSQAAIRVWYVPHYMMKYYVEGYVEGNWGFFHLEYPRYRIVSARIAIATDETTQEERNHLFLEELTGALGLPGDHLLYADSILYDPWTVVQSLSEVDWRMLNLLYNPRLIPGMTEQEAREILKAEMGI